MTNKFILLPEFKIPADLQNLGVLSPAKEKVIEFCGRWKRDWIACFVTLLPL